MLSFKIKICGITSIADATSAVELGCGAIGLNFYTGSSRFVDTNLAVEIAEAIARVKTPCAKVGVFVNSTADAINEIVDTVGLDYVQLHGDETPKICRQGIGVPIIRAVRLPIRDSSKVSDVSERSQSKHAIEMIAPWMEHVSAVLLDAAVPNSFGGSGMKLDWRLVGKLELDCPIILAGGLTPKNVALAISTAKPSAVDVASGVELSPGQKDVDLMHLFISESRMEFDSK